MNNVPALTRARLKLSSLRADRHFLTQFMDPLEVPLSVRYSNHQFNEDNPVPEGWCEPPELIEEYRRQHFEALADLQKQIWDLEIRRHRRQ